jgi:hypothetical protein
VFPALVQFSAIPENQFDMAVSRGHSPALVTTFHWPSQKSNWRKMPAVDPQRHRCPGQKKPGIYCIKRHDTPHALYLAW